MRVNDLDVSFVHQVVGFHDARIPFGRTQVYSGMIHCFITVCREEGMLAFYKGASAALIKVRRHTYYIHRWLTERVGLKH